MVDQIASSPSASVMGEHSPLLDNPTTEPVYHGNPVTAQEQRDLLRGLQSRHLSLMALAGTVGTGLFIGLGGSLQAGGPLGALIGYATVGLVVCAVQFALGEVTALLPVTASYVRHSEFLVDPALGFAIGYNMMYGNYLLCPAEITAICVLLKYWTDTEPLVWVHLLIFLTFCVGMAFIGVYGEIEFWIALIKITFMVCFLILGLTIDLGAIPHIPRIGWSYWKDPGPFAKPGSSAQFFGVWIVMRNAVFSFAGVEAITMNAAETRNPRHAVATACKRVFFRVTLFYILAVLIVGLLVPSNDPRLDDQSGTAAQSPFVMAISTMGSRVFPTIVNGVLILSAWSSCNQGLITGTRVLYGLALKKQAPAVFLRTTTHGVPYMCVLLQTFFMTLAFMTSINGALTIFYWLLDLAASSVLINWIVMLLNHQRLLLALKYQNISPSRLPWHNTITIYSTPTALFCCFIFLLMSGVPVILSEKASVTSFLSSYIGIFLTLLAYSVWKITKRTEIVALIDIPLRKLLDEVDRHPEIIQSETGGWRTPLAILWR